MKQKPPRLVTSDALNELYCGYDKRGSLPPLDLVEQIKSLDFYGYLDYHKARRILDEARGSKLVKHPLDYVREKWKIIKQVNYD